MGTIILSIPHHKTCFLKIMRSSQLQISTFSHLHKLLCNITICQIGFLIICILCYIYCCIFSSSKHPLLSHKLNYFGYIGRTGYVKIQFSASKELQVGFSERLQPLTPVNSNGNLMTTSLQPLLKMLLFLRRVTDLCIHYRGMGGAGREKGPK